jgi:acetyl-CoA C-acetyltransferase
MSNEIVIAAAIRTPIGAFQGVLAPATAPQLGAAAIGAALGAANVAPGDVQEVVMGCVLAAGLGQAPARQAALGAGVPKGVPTTTINKMCGSGMKAVMMAADQIRAGDVAIAVAGGLESMSNAPYLLPKARAGMRMGHGEVLDHMFYDGLQSPFDGQLMGAFAEATAQKYGFSRADQDAFAAESTKRALAAIEAGKFEAEIAPVTVKGRKGETVVQRDETPFTVDLAKIPTLKPAFRKDGTVTAASSSSISDGAAAAVLMSAAEAQRRGVNPLARILGYASFAHEPGRRDRETADATRLETGRRPPLRSERSVRGRRDGGDARRRIRSRAHERQRRRLLARSPDRRHRRAHPRNARARAARARRRPRHRVVMYRRRRGDRHRY